MSCYEWTHGYVVLPSAEVSTVWRALCDAVTLTSQKEYDTAQRFWKSLTRKQQTDPDEYMKALRSFREKSGDYGALWQASLSNGQSPRRLLKDDFEWPSNRTEHLHQSDLSISLDRSKRQLTYAVGENNHARDWADETMLGQTWHRVMKEVRWTHGTGGVLLGNDEYNREGGYEHEGGGGSYVVRAYGYVGAKEAPTHVDEFFTTKGWVHVETVMSRTGITGKIKQGRRPMTRSRW